VEKMQEVLTYKYGKCTNSWEVIISCVGLGVKKSLVFHKMYNDVYLASFGGLVMLYLVYLASLRHPVCLWVVS